MKKISIIILFAIFFIGCSSNDYKQNSIPMSELNNIPDKVILNIEPQYRPLTILVQQYPLEWQ